jgi:ribosomal protein S18 acetylase RimI-like enzyme
MVLIRIRRARPDDARAIARVHVASWQAAYRELLPATYLDALTVRSVGTSWRRRLAIAPPGEVVWVSTVEGTVVAFCAAGPARDNRAWNGYAGEVTYLYVHPAIVGNGIGGALMHKALTDLERRGCVWAEVAVLEANTVARRFYEHLGLRFGGARWVDSRFGVAVVRHEKALNPIVDFDAIRGTTTPEAED